MVALAAAMAVAIAAPWGARDGAAAAGSRRHVRLEKSTPADKDTITASPDSLRLWFSEAVELKLTRVRVTAGSRAVKTGSAVRGSGETDPVAFGVLEPLTPGAYSVAWQTASRDGHPVNGKFGFVVRQAVR